MLQGFQRFSAGTASFLCRGSLGRGAEGTRMGLHHPNGAPLPLSSSWCISSQATPEPDLIFFLCELRDSASQE